jgi:hypothetical protein
MKIDAVSFFATVHSTEDPEKVAEAIATLIPFEFEIQSTRAEGHFGNPLIFLEVHIRKKKEIKEFWNSFIERIGEQKNILLEELEQRIDEDGFFYIRIDKQQAYLGELKLISGGDGIVLKVKITTYPLKRDKVLEAAKELILNGY